MNKIQLSDKITAAGRVGYVVKRYPRFSETFIVNEVLAHEAEGLDVEIFSLRPSVDTHFQNIISQVRAPVTFLPPGSVKSTALWKTCHELSDEFPELWPTLSAAKHATVVEAFQAIKLAQTVRERNITHLHAHFATSAASTARMAARIAEISYSVTMHAKDIFHESVEHEDLASKIADAKFVVTVSDFNCKYLADKFESPNNIHRIYNGLDLNVFQFNPSSERKAKIISVGRLVAKKGFCHLIDACRILADRGIAFECEIIGGGELEADLKEQIDRLSLLDYVTLSGCEPQSSVRQKIASSAVFAAPCVIGPDGNRDGLPTVITESLALGTPCVATDVTGIPEIVRHGHTGIIVEQENATALADGLERLLNDVPLRATLAKNGRQLIEQDFDVHKNVSQIRELFRKSALPHDVSASSQLQGV